MTLHQLGKYQLLMISHIKTKTTRDHMIWHGRRNFKFTVTEQGRRAAVPGTPAFASANWHPTLVPIPGDWKGRSPVAWACGSHGTPFCGQADVELETGDGPEKHVQWR